MYKVSITGRAEKDLRKLDRQIKNRVATAIINLANEPRPTGCKKVLSQEGVWRIRVGDWRIGYSIDDKTGQIIVFRIANRSEFYD
ncbi:MAG: type II toxin-antitoxin system RelE family toxin [Pyrinomonadaceae bacterium]